MSKKNKSSVWFRVRRIANRNPRNPRIVQKLRRKFSYISVVALLAFVGISSVIFFSNNFQAQNFSADASGLLGPGFEQSDLSNLPTTATNPSVTSRGGGFTQSGLGAINAVLYNVKDYFKYIAGSLAILYLLIAAVQLVTASDDEAITKGKKSIYWALVALAAVFLTDVIVVAFFEGGKFTGGVPGQSLITITPEGDIQEATLMQNIAQYFLVEARAIFGYIKVLGAAVAILFIFIAGAHMVSAGGNEENIEKEKKYLIHALTAFVTFLMLDNLIFKFIYPASTITGLTSPECVEFLKSGSLTQAAAAGCPSAAQLGQAGSNYILGIVKFFESLIGGIAVFFIVLSGISIIASFGEQERLQKNKKTLLYAGAGLAVVLLSHNLISRFFFVVNPNTGAAQVVTKQGVIELAGVTNFLATFVGVFSVVSIIIAGIIWVANFGSSEIADKAKKIILGAVIGVVLSVSAYAIVNTILSTSSTGETSGTSISIGVSI